MYETSPTQSDADVILDVLAGRHNRFAEIVRRYQVALVRTATSRLGRRDWAEDVVQETFLWAFKCLKSYDSRYNFRTWLWTILWNQCNRHYQQRKRRPQISLPHDPSGSVELHRLGQVGSIDRNTPAAALLTKERNERLDASLRQLPDPQANALRLRFFGGLKFHEIAEVMDCSLSSAKHRVRQGLLKLGRMITDNENTFESSPGDLP